MVVHLPLEGRFLVTSLCNYVIRALIKALENFTTSITCHQKSRNWCVLADKVTQKGVSEMQMSNTMVSVRISQSPLKGS